MSSNLPPGVSVNDLPGNRPEDLEYERLWLHLGYLWVNAGNEPPEEVYATPWFTQAIDIACEFAFNQGYNTAIAERRQDDMEAEYRAND